MGRDGALKAPSYIFYLFTEFNSTEISKFEQELNVPKGYTNRLIDQ